MYSYAKHVGELILKDKQFLLLFMLGSILYFQFSWLPGFFQDGYLYAALGKNAAEKGQWLVPHLNKSSYAEFNDHTNFTFIMEGIFFKLVGSSYTTARIFAGAFSLLTGVSIFLFLKKLNKKKIRYLAFLLFLLVPPLMKKSRFPNIDLPLMLFFTGAMFSYWRAFIEDKSCYWFLCGVFFGLCLLTKGPMGALVPLCIVSHLIFQKKLVLLSSFRPWLGLFLGLFIFSLWPISLYLGGKFYIFERWFEFTILGSIIKSRGVYTPWYTYLVFLTKNVNIIFVLSLLGIYRNWKIYNDRFIFFCSTVFFTTVVLLSIQGLKYSNYLIPLYPFIAILAAFGLNSIWANAQNRLMKIFTILIPFTAVVLLIFPLTSKTRRDPEITKLKEILFLSGRTPKQWIVYNNSYPYWSLTSKNSFEDDAITVAVLKSENIPSCDECIVLVRKEDNSYILKNNNFSSFYIKSFYLKDREIEVYLPRKRRIDLISI